ncbi:MAG TPA: Ig-like domain-containing protein [Anaeromyxobacteraceae bacterium]|nr:Ig-like domain-containing protein [Anaeromyxobacteraceae bacterium]
MARATSRSTRRLLAGAAALALAAAMALLCARTEAATPLTLQTIAIDGSVGDWDAVLGNPLQTTHDGDGSSSGLVANCALSTDRDCPMTGGAGNDLYTFAWTYDASYVYLYIERYGSTSNGVDFFFVADTNRDKRLKGAGDVVVHARWFGSNGTVNVDAGGYLPADGVNGDPIVSASGYVDGFDLPGNNGPLGAITCGSALGAGVTSGAALGRKMELRVPWCAFGVAPKQPFYWHVVSSNNARLDLPVDNIGAPSGGLGSFAQRAVALFPDRSGAVLSPGVVTYDHTVRNDGNDADVLLFQATSSEGARVELLDAGVVIGRDDEGDGTWELTPQLALAAGEGRDLQVRITMPAGRTGQDLTRVTARSADDPGATATATDATHVGSPAFEPETFAAWTQGGVAVGFPETLANGQLDPDVFDLLPGAGCAGAELRITADSAGDQLVAQDATGDGAWDVVDPAYDVNANGLPDLGALAGQSTRTFWFWVKPPAGAPDGSCTVRLAASSPVTSASAAADHTVTVAPALTFTPSYARPGGSLRGVVGESIFFPAVLRNAESVPRAYALTQAITQSKTGATARIWSDPNGDGSASDGALIATTGTVAPFGGTYAVVIELLAGSAANNAVTIATTATASAGGAAATQISEADVAWVASYADPLHARAASVFPPCATVYLHGGGLLPGDTTSYALTWLTPTAAGARAVSPWPTTALGTADDALTLGATAPTGAWTARLVDGPSTRDQDLPFTVELDASVPSLATDKASYRPGESVRVTATFQDAGRTAVTDGSLHYVLDGAPLRTRPGVTVAAGASVADPFTFTLPPDAAPGVRTLSAGWWLSCGAAPFATRSVTFEVVGASGPATPALDPLPAFTGAESLVLSGTAEAGATVTVQVTGMDPVSTVAGADGRYAITVPLPTGAGTDGAYAVTLTATDAGGNVSAPSSPQVVTVDRTAPAAAVLTSPAEGATLAPGTIAVTGTAEPGASVSVVVDGVAHAATADAVTGEFSVDVPLADGGHSVTVTVTDAAGNASTPVDLAFGVATPPPANDSGGGGGCGCGPGGASAPEGLLLVAIGLASFRRRRAPPNPANLPEG